MKLFWSETSPFARKVMVVAHELGVADQLDRVVGSGTPVAPNPETAAYNPLKKLPCLVPEDGPAIFDSSVICQYLISRRSDQTLLPEGSARYATLTLEALCDGICEATILTRYETALRPAELQWQDWVDGQRGKVEAALAAMSRVWGAHLAGRFDLGHAAAGCALSYVDLRLPDMDWRSSHPSLATWHEAFAVRPSAIASQSA